MGNTIRKIHPGWNNLDNNKDCKKFYKPNKKFKLAQKARRKAKEKDALRHILDKEDVIVPEFKKSDGYNWL